MDQPYKAFLVITVGFLIGALAASILRANVKATTWTRQGAPITTREAFWGATPIIQVPAAR